MMMDGWRSSSTAPMGRSGICGSSRLEEAGGDGPRWDHRLAQRSVLLLLSWPRTMMGAWRLSPLAPMGRCGTPGRYHRGVIGAVEEAINRPVYPDSVWHFQNKGQGKISLAASLYWPHARR